MITFKEAWDKYEQENNLWYDLDALENVRVGWDLAQVYSVRQEPEVTETEEVFPYHFHAQIYRDGEVVNLIDGILNFAEPFEADDYPTIKDLLRLKYDISKDLRISITSLTKLS